MELSNDDIALIIIIAIIVFLCAGIIYVIITKRGRKGYSPINSVTFFGATSEFQDVEKKAAIEHMLEVQGGKKMEEEETGEPEKKE